MCSVDSSGVYVCVFLEQAILQCLWTHLSRLVMKEPAPGAQQVVSCTVFRGSAQLGELGKALNFNFKKKIAFDRNSLFGI